MRYSLASLPHMGRQCTQNNHASCTHFGGMGAASWYAVIRCCALDWLGHYRPCFAGWWAWQQGDLKRQERELTQHTGGGAAAASVIAVRASSSPCVLGACGCPQEMHYVHEHYWHGCLFDIRLLWVQLLSPVSGKDSAMVHVVHSHSSGRNIVTHVLNHIHNTVLRSAQIATWTTCMRSMQQLCTQWHRLFRTR